LNSDFDEHLEFLVLVGEVAALQHPQQLAGAWPKDAKVPLAVFSAALELEHACPQPQAVQAQTTVGAPPANTSGIMPQAIAAPPKRRRFRIVRVSVIDIPPKPKSGPTGIL
jgi:hypothetical protein